MTDDAALLDRYARERDEAAFTALVGRHVDLVYASALRQCGGRAAQAQDVTQQVFTDLARRAGPLSRHPALVGWLHTATRYAAMKLQRAEIRRLAREQNALDWTASEPPPAWERLRPVLDAALGELAEPARAALLLRFLEGKSLRDVAACLRVTETAARSRVDRALDQLRARLARRGIASTAAALGLVLTQHATAAAPAGLAAAVASTALLGGGAAGVGWLSLFAMKKILLGCAGVLLVAEFATATVEFNERRALAVEYAALLSTPTTSPLPLPSSAPAAIPSASPSPLPAPDPELTRLQRRLAVLRVRPPGVADAQLLPPGNVGRATGVEALQTLAWALQAGDTELLARYVTFTDDTPENRAAFMASFPAATRARYPTPEQLMLAFSFDDSFRDPPAALQVTEAHTFAGGVQRVSGWVRSASGQERPLTLPLQQTATGWGLAVRPLRGPNNSVDRILARLDPVTGELRPPPVSPPPSTAPAR